MSHDAIILSRLFDFVLVGLLMWGMNCLLMMF